MNKLMSASLTVLIGAVAGVSQAIQVEWDQSAHPTSLADGKVQVEYDGSGNVSKLSGAPNATGDVYLDIVGGDMAFSPASALIDLQTFGYFRLFSRLALAGAGETELAPLELRSSFLGASDYDRVVVPKPLGSVTTVARNMLLAMVTNVTARYDGVPGKKAGGVPCDTFTTFFENDGKVCTFEIQKRTSVASLRGVKIKLTQNGLDVQAQVMGYGHKDITGTTVVEGDIRVEEDHASWTKNGVAENFFVTNLTLLCSGTAQYPLAQFQTNDLDYVALKVGMESPALLETRTATSLPAHGSIEVGPYGCLDLWQNTVGVNVLAGVTRGLPIVVRKGGLLVTSAAYVFKGDDTLITLDGGTMIVSPQAAIGSDSNVYVDDFVLRNGARITGADVRVRAATSNWKIEGTSPSFCDIGLICWMLNSTYNNDVINFDVEDVTNDARTDFTLSGKVVESTTSPYGQVPVVKKGAGKMLVTGAYAMNVPDRPTRLTGGVMSFGDGSLDSGCGFVIAGGSLGCEAGATNAVTTALAVEGSGGIFLGENASLSLGDSSAQAWASGATLTIDGDLSTSRLRFGTSKTALTTLQLKKIAFAGDGDHRAALDDDG